MTRSGRQGWRTEVCRDWMSSQTDRRQRGGRRTQCEASISLRGRGDCKGERGVPLYPFTCSRVTFRHEHTVNGTHLPSRIFPLTLALSLREREPIELAFLSGSLSPLRSGTEPVARIRRSRRIRDDMTAKTQACLADASSAPTSINNEPNTLFSAFS